MTQKRLSVKNMSAEALDMLLDIRIAERRQVAAILEDCIFDYWRELFDQEDELDEAA